MSLRMGIRGEGIIGFSTVGTVCEGVSNDRAGGILKEDRVG